MLNPFIQEVTLPDETTDQEPQCLMTHQNLTQWLAITHWSWYTRQIKKEDGTWIVPRHETYMKILASNHRFLEAEFIRQLAPFHN